MHTTDKASGTSAPVVLIGTHKDKIADPAEHERISRTLHEHFSTNPAFPYNTCDKEGEVRCSGSHGEPWLTWSCMYMLLYCL